MSNCQSEQNIDTTSRGVQNPHVVDLISLIKDEASAPFVRFLILEERPFTEAPEQFSQFEEKFNNYLDYILDGHFHGQYPQYKEHPLEISIESHEPPTSKFEQLFASMAGFAKSVGISFRHQQFNQRSAEL